MPWNEPGKNDSGGQEPPNNRPNNQQKPPDFEQIIKDAINSIKNMFGFGGNNKTKPAGSTGSGQGGPLVFFVVILAGLALWSSAYRIDESERGVVLVFGKYSHTLRPGLSFTWPQPIAKVYRENVQKIRQEDNSGQMLTEDKNLIEIDYSVQYRVDEERVNNFLFNIADPEKTVSQAAESAMRQVAGTSTMDHIINESRTDVNFAVQSELQKMLDNYKAGVEVRQVNITEVHPPSNVKDAFDGSLLIIKSFANIPDMFDRTAVINGMSKGFAMTGWRIGYMAGPEWLVAACEKMQSQFTSAASSISQRATLAALTGSRQPSIEMCEAFHRRRDELMKALKALKNIKFTCPEGAFYLLDAK